MTIAKVCKNCGGIVEGSKCKYCGTEYEEMPDNGYEGYLLLGGEKIHGYVAETRCHDILPDGIFRDRTHPSKREFKFIEM